MPNSLRCMISKLRHKGQISDVEYKELITKLENHDRVIKEQTNTTEWLIGSYEAKCSNCDYLVYGSELNTYKEWKFCPNCGAKMKKNEKGEGNGR